MCTCVHKCALLSFSIFMTKAISELLLSSLNPTVPLPPNLIVRCKESNKDECKLFINYSLYVFEKTQPATLSGIWHTSWVSEEKQRLDKRIMKKDLTLIT